MSDDPRVQDMQRDVQRLLGRCVLRLQQYERLMKAMLAQSELSGTLDGTNVKRLARVPKRPKKSLGSLVDALFESYVVLPGENSTSSEPAQSRTDRPTMHSRFWKAPLRKFLVAVLLSASPLAHSDPLSILAGNVDAKSRAARANAAAELLADIDRFASLVQSPRPAEIAWVEAEQAQISQIKNTEDSIARIAQLPKSPEFQQYKLHGHLQEIRNALRCVVQAPPTLQREMFCWAVASFLLDETDVFAYGTNILLRAKRLPEDLARRVGAATDDGIQLRYRWVSRGIQQYVVLPYLRGEVR